MRLVLPAIMLGSVLAIIACAIFEAREEVKARCQVLDSDEAYYISCVKGPR